MRIAILSDTHGDHAMVARALNLLQSRRIERILHCGDIDDSLTIQLFAGTPTDFVLGNCDQQPSLLAHAAELAGAKLHGRFADLTLGGKRIAMIHGDDKKAMEKAEKSGVYDFLFYGHTHVAEQHQTGKTTVLNPGALHRARPKTLAILDLETSALETVIVSE